MKNINNEKIIIVNDKIQELLNMIMFYQNENFRKKDKYISNLEYEIREEQRYILIKLFNKVASIRKILNEEKGY